MANEHLKRLIGEAYDDYLNYSYNYGEGTYEEQAAYAEYERLVNELQEEEKKHGHQDLLKSIETKQDLESKFSDRLAALHVYTLEYTCEPEHAVDTAPSTINTAITSGKPIYGVEFEGQNHVTLRKEDTEKDIAIIKKHFIEVVPEDEHYFQDYKDHTQAAISEMKDFVFQYDHYAIYNPCRAIEVLKNEIDKAGLTESLRDEIKEVEKDVANVSCDTLEKRKEIFWEERKRAKAHLMLSVVEFKAQGLTNAEIYERIYDDKQDWSRYYLDFSKTVDPILQEGRDIYRTFKWAEEKLELCASTSSPNEQWGRMTKANDNYSNDIAEQYGRVRRLVGNVDILKTIDDIKNAKTNNDFELACYREEKLKSLLNNFYQTEAEIKNSIIEPWPIDYHKAFYQDEHRQLIMPIGVAGAGKSTLAKELHYECPNLQVVSSDEIRKELYGSEEIQKNPKLVFEEMNKRTVKLLKDGYDVYYDATNLESKYREATLKEISENVPGTYKIACVFDNDIEQAISQNATRERNVPDAVIRTMGKKLIEQPPTKDEGFDFVYSSSGIQKKIEDIAEFEFEISQRIKYAFWGIQESKDIQSYKYAMEDLKDIDRQFKMLQNYDDESAIKAKCIKELNMPRGFDDNLKQFNIDEYLKESQNTQKNKHLKM